MSAFVGKYAEELIQNAKYIATPGKGILAADESTGTIGKRLASINVENIESNRQSLRELLFTSPNALSFLSGVILFEETLYQKTSDGKPFVEVLQENKDGGSFTQMLNSCFILATAMTLLLDRGMIQQGQRNRHDMREAFLT
ncbi:hypothetical protein Ddye_027859 [Dipteronia dyeriana]|uniref:fructose-bisphosphate aldolase n=1 Tax=Dipteronia dyeriana TaxID=168575 RepID=A0AAD9WQK4_9ROSI|nr:hypothetical protein Ddye_027859 [Dipteronia dyeriana]